MLRQRWASALACALTVLAAAACESSGPATPQAVGAGVLSSNATTTAAGQASTVSASPEGAAASSEAAPSSAASSPAVPASTSHAQPSPSATHATTHSSTAAATHPKTTSAPSTSKPPVADCMHHATIDEGTAVCGAGEPHPDGATAKCHDGSYSYSTTPSGTCSHHKGVAVWYY